MGQLARVPLDGGGSILIEATDEKIARVKASRIGDTIHDLPTNSRRHQAKEASVAFIAAAARVSPVALGSAVG
ncbi:hypothetical protein AB0C90_34650 [Streptomyces sp. NPDC048550]|uniref:hypothetical protein n=1 Tax=Streptomyces sp. NPDC048550 TaxID=3155739 RepID=UPI00343C3513